MAVKHYCILGYYGDNAPIGIHPAWDGELFTEEAAQGTIRNIEHQQQFDPNWQVETPFGMCRPLRAYLQSGRIIWELEEVTTPKKAHIHREDIHIFGVDTAMPEDYITELHEFPVLRKKV